MSLPPLEGLVFSIRAAHWRSISALYFSCRLTRSHPAIQSAAQPIVAITSSTKLYASLVDSEVNEKTECRSSAHDQGEKTSPDTNTNPAPTIQFLTTEHISLSWVSDSVGLDTRNCPIERPTLHLAFHEVLMTPLKEWDRSPIPKGNH